jgi:hypothetical protein
VRHKIKYVGEPDGVIIQTFGLADVAGFKAMNADLTSDERFTAGMPILLDHSSLDAGRLSAEDIRAIALDVVEHSERLGPSPIALIASDAITQLAARSSVEQAASADLRPRIFDTLADGIVWLLRQQENR